MKTYNKELLQKHIDKVINEQNHFWFGCVIGLRYGILCSIRVSENEELSYGVNSEEELQKTFQPIVRVKYGSPYEGQEKKGYLVNWFDEINHNPVNVGYLKRKPEPEIFETGATKHHINSLILYTDNTRNLVELRDKIYKENINEIKLKPEIFVDLCENARYHFICENGYEPIESKPIDKMRYKKNYSDVLEFCMIFANRFDNWKLEHNQ